MGNRPNFSRDVLSATLLAVVLALVFPAHASQPGGGTDTEPDYFLFPPRVGVALFTPQVSDAVVPTGYDAPASVSVVDGEYSIGCLPDRFTKELGTIEPGQSVCVRHVSAVAPATQTHTTLTIGGLDLHFFTTTTISGELLSLSPAILDFGAWQVGTTGIQRQATLVNAGADKTGLLPPSVTGDFAILFTDCGATLAADSSCMIVIAFTPTATGARSGALEVKGDKVTASIPLAGMGTDPSDLSPDPFSFPSQVDVPAGTRRTSEAVVPTGFYAPTIVTVSAGELSIGCNNTFTTGSRQLSPGQSVCVRHISSLAPLTAVTTTLTVGGVAATFTTITDAIEPDTTPDPFGFASQTNVQGSTTITSESIQPPGFNAVTSIAVANGEYAIGSCSGIGARYTSAAGLLLPGESLCVRHRSANVRGTTVTTTLTIGGVSGTFSSTTEEPLDSVPDPFSFAAQADVPVSSPRTSDVLIPTGYTAFSLSLSVVNGEYSLGCSGTFTADPGTLSRGQSVCVRHTSAATPLATTTTTLTVGGVSGTFTSTTAAVLDANGDADNDGIPNAVEPAESRNPFLKDNDIFGVPRLFAMQQYRDFLGREAEPAGIQFYVDLLSAGTLSREQVIESFLASPEFTNGLPPVIRLYFAFFNRIPDYGGLIFQVSAFRSGTPLELIAQNFYNAPEFTNTYGALTNDQYITLVYQNVLGRAPDPGGFDFYKNLLDTGAITKGQMMIGFSESPEFQQITDNESWAVSVYVGLLRRTPEQAGLDFYVDLLDTGTPRSAIIPGFFNSPEYHNRFLP